MRSISVIVFAFLSTFSLIPIIKAISLKLNLVDKPDKRKENKSNLVRLGGIGIFLGIYISILILLNFPFADFRDDYFLKSIFYISPLFFFLGLIDDIYVLSPFIRLIFQFLLSVFVWNKGIQVDNLIFNVFGNVTSLELNSTLSILFTFFWIVGMINAINWMDGLDGLASGIISISIIGLIIITISNGMNQYIYVLFSILGACLAFLIYNVYPAKILMGDGGSYLLGFFAASLSIYFTNFESLVNTFDFLCIQVFLLFAVPIIDMVTVIFTRINNGKSIFLPDRSHLHHRLIDLGFSHKDTVIMILAISQLFASFSITLCLQRFNPFLIIASLFILCNIFYYRCDRKNLINLKIVPRKG